uniref:Uncharacterized protein n=1 Tax=Opuntia streptacantha TaxID=393608 RepID=A0A7C9CL09_OPUST
MPVQHHLSTAFCHVEATNLSSPQQTFRLEVSKLAKPHRPYPRRRERLPPRRPPPGCRRRCRLHHRHDPRPENKCFNSPHAVHSADEAASGGYVKGLQHPGVELNSDREVHAKRRRSNINSDLSVDHHDGARRDRSEIGEKLRDSVS